MTKRLILDSGVVADLIFDRRNVRSRLVEARRSGQKIGMGTPVLGEILGGLEASTSRDKSLAIAMPALRQLICWPFDHLAAQHYGRIFAELRRIGRPMQQVDMQIAAIAFALGDATVITYDSDLDDVPNLNVENWLKS